MINIPKYAEPNYPFPRHDVSPKTKESKEYALAFSRAFYSIWLRGEAVWGYSDRVKFDGLRRLAVGEQPDDLYYKLCYGVGDQGETIRKGWMNVNWDILKVAVKYRNAFVGMFTDIDFDIQATSVNPFSTLEREEKKWKFWVEKKMMPKIGIKPEDIGVDAPLMDMETEASPMEPESITELELLESLGFFRLKEEVASELFIKATFDTISNFSDEIKDKLLEDLWDCGKAVIKDYVDIPTQKVKVRYVDFANCIIRKRTDGSVLDGGEMRIMSIADLRAESDFDEETLMNVAFNFCDQFGNMGKDLFTRNKADVNKYMRNGSYGFFYDDIKIAVLDCEYYTVNDEYITRVNSDKGEKYFKDEFGKIRNSPKRKTIIKKQPTFYRAKWIVGTEHVYDYGLQYDIPRPHNSEARSSFHYVELTTPSPVDVASPAFHHCQLMWLKFQNAWAKAKPDMIAYDESLLVNSVVGQKITVDQFIKMSEQSGRLVFKTRDARGQVQLAANASGPVVQVPGGIGKAGQDFVESWNVLQSLLMELTGMTPQTVAGSIPERTGKAVSEIAVSSTNNIMRPMINAYRSAKLRASQNVLMRGKIVFKHNEQICKDYYDILGKDMVEVLKITSNKSASQYGIKLVPRINDVIREKMEAAAIEAMATDRNGGVGITYNEYLLILNLLDQGANPKLIQGALGMFIQRRMKQKSEEAAANQKAQSDSIIEQTNAASMNKAKEMILGSHLKMKEIQFEKELGADIDVGTTFLNNMLQEAMGIMLNDPEALASGMAMGGGMGEAPQMGMPPEMGGMPPEMGGMPPEMAAMMGQPMV